ncbi:MAG: hypothetical protein MPJ24_00700 [Pirellulaceae bacterium]|nr:hypothetical protein [Pirellulaceae bacterium]
MSKKLSADEYTKSIKLRYHFDDLDHERLARYLGAINKEPFLDHPPKTLRMAWVTPEPQEDGSFLVDFSFVKVPPQLVQKYHPYDFQKMLDTGTEVDIS